MLSSDDSTYTSPGPIERSFRAASRRELINEKRQRNTDILTYTNGENGKTVVRQLREENKRLRWELDELDHLPYQHKQTQAQLKQKIQALHLGHPHFIQQY